MTRLMGEVLPTLRRLIEAAAHLYPGESDKSITDSANDVRLCEITELLTDISRGVDAGFLPATILGHKLVAKSLLLTVAVACRYNLTFEAADEPRLQLCVVTMSVIGSLMSRPEPLTVLHSGFPRALFRMQFLHCLSQQLAAASSYLRKLFPQKPLDSAAPAEAPAETATATIIRARPAVHFISSAIKAAQVVTWFATFTDFVLHPASSLSLKMDMVAALHESALLEHASQAAALAVMALAEPLMGVEELWRARIWDDLDVVRTSLGSTYKLVEGLFQSSVAEGGRAALALHQVMSGPCVQHLVLAAGVAALCAADGGPTYGLAPALLRFAAQESIHNFARPGAQNWGGSGSLQASSDVDWQALSRFVRALEQHSNPSSPLPGWQVACPVALRVGWLVVQTATAQCTTACEDAVEVPRSSAPRRSGQGTADACGNVQHRGPRTAARPQLLPPAAGSIACEVLCTLDRILETSTAAPGWWAIVTERWRLCFAAIKAAWPLPSDAEMSGLLHCMQLEVPLPSDGDGMVLSIVPLKAGAALAGGLQNFLECLLRAAGRDPGGCEAQLLNELMNKGLFPLHLACVYGDPRDTASMTITLDKLLRHLRSIMSTEGIEKLFNKAAESTKAILLLYAHLLRCVATLFYDGCTWMASAALRGASSGAADPQLGSLMAVVLRQWLHPVLALVFSSSQFPLWGEMRTVISWLLHEEMWACIGTGWVQMLLTSAAASSSSSSSSGPCGCVREAPAAVAAPPGGSWQADALEGVDLIAMLETALRCGNDGPTAFAESGHRRRIFLLDHPAQVEWRLHMAGALCRVAMCFPEAVRSAAAAAANHASDRRRSRASRNAGRDGRSRADGTGAAGGRTSGTAPPHWPPGLVRSLGAALLEDGQLEAAAAVEALAVQLEQWAAGGCEDVKAGPLGRVPLPPNAEADAAARFLVSPGELRGMLGRCCANPSCLNLEGDSEAELRLQACGRCGTVSYCSRDCQRAHWAAGHKAECSKGCRSRG